MNEKSFKFKESFYTAINSLNEKQAGRLVKGICEYAFNGKEFTSKDANLNSTFTLIKTAIDEDKQNEERSKLGGEVTIYKHSADDSAVLIKADVGEQKCSLLDVLSSAFIAVNTDYNALYKGNKRESV